IDLRGHKYDPHPAYFTKPSSRFDLPASMPPSRYTSRTATSGGSLLANAIASLWFETTAHSLKPNVRIDASTSKAIKYSSSTIRARPDKWSLIIGHLPLAVAPVVLYGNGQFDRKFHLMAIWRSAESRPIARERVEEVGMLVSKESKFYA